MTCPQCGRMSADCAAVCAGCGARLSGDEAPTLTRPPEHAPRSDQPAPGGSRAAGGGRLAPGTRLGERYEIVSLLGEGGMGSVYEARDRALDRTVALKVIRPEMASRPEIMERFKREILLASRVTHRNVLRIHDLGYVIMHGGAEDDG